MFILSANEAPRGFAKKMVCNAHTPNVQEMPSVDGPLARLYVNMFATPGREAICWDQRIYPATLGPFRMIPHPCCGQSALSCACRPPTHCPPTVECLRSQLTARMVSWRCEGGALVPAQRVTGCHSLVAPYPRQGPVGGGGTLGSGAVGGATGG